MFDYNTNAFQGKYSIRKRWLALFMCLLLSSGLVAQTTNEANLFCRYDKGTSLFRISEDILGLILGNEAQKREKIAIRVCSQRSMPEALHTSTADPFEIGDFLQRAHGYRRNDILLLRSSSCVPSNDPGLDATEVWTIPHNGLLPGNDEFINYENIKREFLGKRIRNRGASDYQHAVSSLIPRLKNNPNSYGVILGYYVNHPSKALRRNIQKSEKILKAAGINKNQYFTVIRYWHEGGPDYPNFEPSYPNVILISTLK